MKQSTVWFRFVAMVVILGCLVAPVSALSVPHGTAGTVGGAGSAMSPTDPAAATSAITIDFDAIVSVPVELRQPIAAAMSEGVALLPQSKQFTVSALRVEGDWLQAILVPTYIVDAGWEIDFQPNEIIEVLGQRVKSGEFSAHLRGTSGGAQLQRQIPRDFVDFAESPNTPQTGVDYLFPWTSGQNWYKTQGWHSGNNLDFQPVARSNPSVHFAVLAAAQGTLTEICNDGYQSILRVAHSDGNTQYTHLDKNSIRRDLLGQSVVRGQFMGLLYNGHQGERDYQGYHYQYWTNCGYGTAFHLHFTLPQQNMTIDGRNANTVASSAFATQYGSSNTRTDNGSGDQDGGGINYGDTKNGTINPANDTDDFTFNGTAGEIVEIRQTKNGSSLDSYVELSGPNNYYQFDDDGGGSYNSFLRRTLPTTGQYRIRAKSYNGASTGAYTLNLVKVTVPNGDSEGDPRWIAFEQTLNGTINPTNDQDTYYFNGTSGRVVSIRMNATGGGLDTYLELYSPSGTFLKSNDDGGGNYNSWLVHTLTANGTYRIVARSYSNGSSGIYTVKLESVTGGSGSGNLARNKGVATSSVEFSGVEGWKATDGNVGTRWSSQFSDSQWIYVDLGQNRNFNQVVLKWESAYGRRFGIYRWTGSQWQNVYWTDNGTGGTNTINFSLVNSRYVLMQGAQRGTPWGYSLYEFEVYDTTTTTVPDVPPDDPGKVDTGSVAPLPPTDGGKDVLAGGEGEYGQETTPLESGDAVTVTEQTTTTQTVMAFINSPSDLDAWTTSVDTLQFDGVGSSQGPTGTLSITAYNWRSEPGGQLGSQAVFTLPVTTLLPGQYTIYFKTQNELGVWSQEVTTTLSVVWPNRVYLPAITR